MKITFEKRDVFVVDTAKERRRIAKAFARDAETRKRLTRLMDCIEYDMWEEAVTELESDWWQGYDERQECPRCEFVGMLDIPGSSWATYMDLVYAMYAPGTSIIRVMGKEDN